MRVRISERTDAAVNQFYNPTQKIRKFTDYAFTILIPPQNLNIDGCRTVGDAAAVALEVGNEGGQVGW